MKRLPTTLFACAAVVAVGVFSPVPASATGAYSWVDAAGVTHYSDQPPPASAKKARRLSLSGGETRAVTAVVEEKPGENQAMARAAGYGDEEIKRNCDIASKNLVALTSAAPMPEGSDQAETRDQSIQQAQGQVKLFCK